MRRPIIEISLVSMLLVSIVVSLTGCSRSEDAAQSSAPKAPPAVQAATPGKTQGGGGIPDMNVYPAPAGVKTGIEGGKK
jgi:hypothetical protein